MFCCQNTVWRKSGVVRCGGWGGVAEKLGVAMWRKLRFVGLVLVPFLSAFSRWPRGCSDLTSG
jgi:hypothetical protein